MIKNDSNLKQDIISGITGTMGCASGAAATTVALTLACISLGLMDRENLPGDNLFQLPIFIAVLACMFQPFRSARQREGTIIDPFLSNARWGFLIAMTGVPIGIAVVLGIRALQAGSGSA